MRSQQKGNCICLDSVCHVASYCVHSDLHYICTRRFRDHVLISDFRMDIKLELGAKFKLCIKLRKSALEMLKQAFANEAMR